LGMEIYGCKRLKFRADGEQSIGPGFGSLRLGTADDVQRYTVLKN